MSAIIKAENLCFSYPVSDDEIPTQALRDVSFEIEEGSFVAILGHNGSGKSTLAKLLCMINAPDSGNLYIFGKNMNRFCPFDVKNIKKMIDINAQVDHVQKYMLK